MSRRRIDLLVALLVGAAIAAAPARAGSRTPAPPWSVLVITVDNLRPDRMSLYGHERETTPNLDAFAAESFVFSQAFATSAWTSPGIVSLFTGYLPPVHGQSGRFTYYDAEMVAPLRLLADRGYERFAESPRGPSHEDYGFERYVGMPPDRLESFIEERVTDHEPFFAWTHLRDVHLPYRPAPEFAAKFGPVTRTSPAVAAVQEHKIILRHPERVDIPYTHAGAVTFAPADVVAVRTLYDGAVATVDARLGRAIERMRAIGLLERTIVVITADHGEELFDHGWLGHASTGYDAKLYDELVRVPLIVRVPGAKLQGRSDALVQQIDLMPTVLELLGVPADGLRPPPQGRSLVPLMRGGDEPVHETLYLETTRKGWTTPEDELDERLVAVRSRTQKVIWVPEADGTMRIEAYDLVVDPGEQHNRYGDESAAFAGLVQARAVWDEANRRAAAALVLGGARRRLQQVQQLAADPAGLGAAVEHWQALQTMERTWGLNPEPFYAQEPYHREWQEVQREAAAALAAAFATAATRPR